MSPIAKQQVARMATEEMTFSLTVEEAAARIERIDRFCRAFITTRLPEARREAALRAEGPSRGPLDGVPYALKDLWDTADLPTSGGSWRHKDRRPERDCPVRSAFDAAGAVMLGKTNLSDMALLPEASSWVGGSTRNPFDPKRTSGGSSGGAAAAVALGMAGFDWGSDFGGSIRQPSAYCGVLGMRLSASAWPVVGDFPGAPESVRSLNGQGPITRTVAQMRAVLAAARASHTGPARPFSPRGVRLWAPDHGLWPTFCDDAAPHCRAIGQCEIARDLPKMTRVRNLALAMYSTHFYDLAAAEPTLPLGQGIVAALSAVILRGAFGDKRLHPGTAKILLLMALGRHTIFWNRERIEARTNAFRAEIERIWDAGCFVALPACGYPPPIIGTSSRNTQLITCSVPGNLADATSIAIPFGAFDSGTSRLPRALQLMGPPGSQDVLLDAAEAVIASRDRDPALRFDWREIDLSAIEAAASANYSASGA